MFSSFFESLGVTKQEPDSGSIFAKSQNTVNTPIFLSDMGLSPYAYVEGVCVWFNRNRELHDKLMRQPISVRSLEGFSKKQLLLVRF